MVEWRCSVGWFSELKLFVVGYDFDGAVKLKTRYFVEAAIRKNEVVVVPGSQTTALV